MSYSYGYLSGFANSFLYGNQGRPNQGFTQEQQQPQSSVYAGQLNQINRDLAWVKSQLQRQIDYTDRLWIAATNVSTTRSIDPSLTIASISVPPPPEGYAILVEGWMNAAWGTSSALDSTMRLEVGSQILAETDLSSDSTVGSIVPVLSTVYTATQTTNFKLELDYTTASSSLTMKNRGLRARYVRKGAFAQAQLGFSPEPPGTAYGMIALDTFGAVDAATQVIIGTEYSITALDTFGASVAVTLDTVAAAVADWYVSTAGNDGNSGTARDDAFLTISYAMGTASNNDSILVLAGDYNESVEITVPGIVLSGDVNTTGRPHVYHTANHVFYDTASNADDVTIEGFEVSSASRVGIIVDNGSDNWTIQDNRVHHCIDSGIWIYDGSGHVVQKNVIYLIANDTDGESFGVRMNCDTSTVDSNVFYLIQKAAIRDRGNRCIMSNNYIYACYSGCQLNYYEGANVIQNNYTTHVQRGSVFKHYDGNRGMSTVKYNEYHDAMDACMTFGIDPSTDAASVEMTYNLFHRELGGGGYTFVKEGSNDVGPGMTLDYNLYWPEGSTPDYYYYDTDGVNCASVAEIVSDTDYEDNGSEYGTATAGSYGNQTAVTSQGEPDWVPIDVTVASASHNTAAMASAATWHWVSDWAPGTGGPAWIIFDCGAGTSTSFDYVLYQPYAANTAFKTYSIEVSDDLAAWTTVHSAATYDQKNTLHIFEIDTPTAGRYFRLNAVNSWVGNMTVACVEFGNLA